MRELVGRRLRLFLETMSVRRDKSSLQHGSYPKYFQHSHVCYDPIDLLAISRYTASSAILFLRTDEGSDPHLPKKFWMV